MRVYRPDHPNLTSRLQHTDLLLVVCYCAAWCDTCTQYLPKLDALAQQQPNATFVWVDIEEYPELLDDEDVENFPTILLERNGKPLFFGPILPHIGQLERLIAAMQESQTFCDSTAPANVKQRLLDAQS